MTQIRKIRVEVEVKDGKYTIVLSAPGIETVRHEYASEEEVRAALQRGFDSLRDNAHVVGNVMTPAGEAFLAGETPKR